MTNFRKRVTKSGKRTLSWQQRKQYKGYTDNNIGSRFSAVTGKTLAGKFLRQKFSLHLFLMD